MMTDDRSGIACEQVSSKSWMGEIRSGFESGQLVEALDALIARSILERVNDVHFRSDEAEIQILVRKDGFLSPLLTIPAPQGETLFTRLKVLGRMVSYRKRVPQDGHIDPKPYTNDPAVDIRLAIAPTVTGEQAVIRILYGSSGLIPLEALGWPPEVLAEYETALLRRRGVVLFTGPCGSGKTTTIAASIQMLLSRALLNICTVEDPVEYRLPGVSQMSIDSVAGLGYAEGIRAWLRHDPDILAVGEIRDGETAAVVMEAGLVGHLVLSTIHAGSTAAVLVRLLDMGIHPGTLIAALEMLISQRLVRRLCPDCREKSSAWPAELADHDRPKEINEFYEARGCPACEQTGYRGRQGIFEMVLLNDPIREAILARSALSEMKKLTQKAARCTLWSHGWNLVAAGVTTPGELLRGIGD